MESGPRSRGPSPLTARDLTKRFRSTIALDGVSLDLPTASRTALVGPNGAGKSTLLRCWMGFERPTSGAVSVLGSDPIRDRQAVVGRLSYLHQGPNLYLDLSGRDHLRLAATLRDGFDLELAEHRLREVGVPLNVACRALSGGQQAQLSIAIAIAAGGEILLLDEPLANLDPLARENFATFLLEAATSARRSFVVSSHDIAGLEQLCDFVVLLDRGRVVLAEGVASVIDRHAVVENVDLVLPAVAIVGRVLGPGGQVVAVVRREDVDGIAARQPSLQQVLLAYLRAAASAQEAL